MNIYRIFLKRSTCYDQYGGAVVIAATEQEARETWPKPAYSVKDYKTQLAERNPRSSSMVWIPLGPEYNKYRSCSYRELKEFNAGPWEITFHYSKELGFHAKINGNIPEEDNFLLSPEDEWTNNPDEVMVEFIGTAIASEKNRVVLSSYRNG